MSLKERAEAKRNGFKEISDYLSYLMFLLERELGYQINADSNGLIVMERIKMLRRFKEEMKNSIDEKELRKL